MSQLRVLKTLGLAQLQDGGRFGCRHLGVTQGGALDWLAAGQANRLLGNPPDAAVVEIPWGGLSLLIEEDSTLALCGADLAATLDGEAVENNTSFAVRAGQQLDCHSPRLGVRGYLSAPDGFSAPNLLGACATVSRERLGGLHGDGRALQTGDLLAYGIRAVRPTRLPQDNYFDLSAPASLDLLFGAEYARFAGPSLFALVNQAWQVDRRADRMGARLSGPRLDYQGPGLVSTGIPLGAIQVPPDGQPIILLQDRQTIGGYPRIGALTPLAVARLAQCSPGQMLHLRTIGQEAALQQTLHWLYKLQQQL
ncbi:5-oxoprolinase subunit C family protein [Halopseudomonas salegens]|uniref:Biotin-dependent carboxylase uncharacterized domain-containing protein n=1 Tax=Halopseudomonas salegens TaxID=1434072 RepID=A0A1H2HKM0_9GAMM|nr:biotin-dependent carboxyltransferase family protein [Halopseudomonas salegens]SDU32332.1 biotin-dependent carboxylase uncharacterized domain-containing protein [Halopseudomonas salegens]